MKITVPFKADSAQQLVQTLERFVHYTIFHFPFSFHSMQANAGIWKMKSKWKMGKWCSNSSTRKSQPHDIMNKWIEKCSKLHSTTNMIVGIGRTEYPIFMIVSLLLYLCILYLLYQIHSTQHSPLNTIFICRSDFIITFINSMLKDETKKQEC